MDVAKCLPDMSCGKILPHQFYGYLLDFALKTYAILVGVASKIVRRDSVIHKLLLLRYGLSPNAFDLSHQKFLFSLQVSIDVVILMFSQSLCQLNCLYYVLSLVCFDLYLRSRLADFDMPFLFHPPFHIFLRC